HRGTDDLLDVAKPAELRSEVPQETNEVSVIARKTACCDECGDIARFSGVQLTPTAHARFDLFHLAREPHIRRRGAKSAVLATRAQRTTITGEDERGLRPIGETPDDARGLVRDALHFVENYDAALESARRSESAREILLKPVRRTTDRHVQFFAQQPDDVALRAG